MATTSNNTTNNPTIVTTKPAPSPNLSVSTASLNSQDGNGKFALPPAANGTPVNGETNVRPVYPAKKPTMSSRLSGMFTRKEAKNNSEANVSRDSLATQAVPENAVAGQPSPLTQAGASRPAPPSRTSSQRKDSPVPERSKSHVDRKKDQRQGSEASHRFWINEDGTHEHHLKVTRRQEKLTDMFKEVMLLGKKKEHHEQPLSLMANWADQMRNEKEKAAADPKMASPSSQTLVQKYGKCQEVVGRGAFGIVRLAHKTDEKDPKREQLFAVKEFHQRPGESAKKYQKRLTSEFCISSALKHPNIITTLDLIQDAKGDYCEVMEYCGGGDLYTLILSAGHLEVLEADCFFKQLMRAVDYMHEMGVAHRDLKPENMLITTHGAIKITDFGNGECFRMAWEEEAHMTAGLCGSAPYIAPEEYVDQEFDPRAVDVWACGVIYMAMRTGRHLWRVAQKGQDEFFDKYLEDRREEEGYKPIEVLKRVSCVRSRTVVISD